MRRLEMLNHAAPLQDKRVLEFGCGLGTYVREIRRYTPHVVGFDVEIERLQEGLSKGVPGMLAAVGERLPFPTASFDVVFSNEVIEHVSDDRACCQEIARVLRPHGRAVIFVPNRLYFFETHGIYWRGRYQFGNKLFVNWLPTKMRNRLAPHVRAYTRDGLKALFDETPTRIISLTQIYPGDDNSVARFGALGRVVRRFMQALESTPLSVFGLSHLLVVEKV
jgi:SAM-dependent methyltransferase